MKYRIPRGTNEIVDAENNVVGKYFGFRDINYLKDSGYHIKLNNGMEVGHSTYFSDLRQYMNTWLSFDIEALRNQGVPV